MVFQVPEDKDSKCYSTARKRGQKTFSLIEQDVTAVRTIAFWIYLNIETCSPEKLRDALEDCIAWREYKNRKLAD
jgi:acyl-ACP thioesterase